MNPWVDGMCAFLHASVSTAAGIFPWLLIPPVMNIIYFETMHWIYT